MSKYIIDTGDYLFTTDGVLVVGFDCDNKPATFYNSLDNLEELNSDYINENCGELQDKAYKQGYADAERIWRAPSSDNEFYQKGFEDGKNSIDMGCEGCRYSLRFAKDEPCKSCSNCYKSKYEPAPQEDDRIEVGDIVERYIDGKLDSKVIFLQEDGGYWRCLFDTGAVLMTFAYPKGQFKKTGKHYDIASILEAVRTHD